jgi:putative transposase
MTKDKTERKCDDLIDALLEKHGISPEAVLGENGLIAQFKKRVVERALAGELTHHLGYAKGEAPEELDNHRNGYSKKTVVGEDGAMEIEVPRDRGGSFEPLLIAKGQKRFEGFDEKIIAMYARGMTVREIQGFLLDQYKVEVSADFISTVTDGLPLGERADLYRALEPLLPLLLRLERAPGVGSRAEGHLPGRNRGGRRQASHGVRSRPLGQKVSDDR